MEVAVEVRIWSRMMAADRAVEDGAGTVDVFGEEEGEVEARVAWREEGKKTMEE